jgi:hypothetical protein
VRRLWTPRWLLLHATAFGLVVAFLALGYWQLNRAASGNLLSFGYAFEWPAFAAFVVFVWIKEMRQTLTGDSGAPETADETQTADETEAADAVAGVTRQPAASSRRPTRAARGRTGAAYDDSDDEELAAYNRYLAWRGAHPHASPAEYPG